ncbi:MAG TPA: YdeI/OmpD-associated family protein [Burkholderiales bacterium]|jgi:uncharacterized protein YdeI (YjbR/CyaY-like superfamily)
MTVKDPKANPKVDAFLARAKSWRGEMQALRAILLASPLAEDFKWGKPCYTIEGGNVLVLAPLKEYCAFILFKGALMKDPKGILVQPTENSQAGRQLRFSSLQQITRLKAALKGYIAEAIAVEKSGAKVAMKTVAEYPVPGEFQERLDKLPALRAAFEALTPGRRKAYLLHFAGAKQSATRAARVAKCMPRILEGKGIDD